ncbi:MAG: OstA-like protein, partial [Flavisolibacter sp.]
MKTRTTSLLLIFLFTALLSKAQGMADSTSKQPVDILHADVLSFKNPNPTTELKILSGNVELRQGNTLFWCDSCVINSNAHIFEAFGKVHINDNDTANVYSDYLRYFTN